MRNQLDRQELGFSEAPLEVERGEDVRSRRSFFRKSTLGAVPAVLAASAIARGNDHSDSRPGDVIPSLYNGWNARNFRAIQNDENNHVALLLSLLGANARPKPTFRNLLVSNATQFVTLSIAFENTGVGAYLQAGSTILDPTYAFLANQVALVEGYHSGYLNTLANQNLVPNGNSFANGLTLEEVVDRVSPFIASLNGGPPPTFQYAKSAANDIDVLNFSLLLEYLEAEFYNLNVDRIFN